MCGAVNSSKNATLICIAYCIIIKVLLVFSLRLKGFKPTAVKETSVLAKRRLVLQHS